MDDCAFVRELARRAKRRRQACGLKQRDVAPAMGMSEPHYSRFEAGKFKLMHPAELARLAEALHTSVAYLLQETDEAGPVPDRWCPGGELSLVGVTPLPA